MSTRINNGKDSYLHCSVVLELDHLGERYSSASACFKDYRVDILESCKEQDYTEAETQKVLDHYEFTLHNASIEWTGE